MKNASPTGILADLAAKFGHGLAIGVLALGLQPASAQTTMKFAGPNSAAPAPVVKSQPITINRVEQVTASQSAAEPNEVFVFTFVPQRTASLSPITPLPANGQAAKTPAAAATDDVFAILARAGREAGNATTTPAANAPAGATPTAANAPQMTKTTITAAPQTTVAAAKPEASMTLAPATTAAPTAASTPTDMFSALANAGRSLVRPFKAATSTSEKPSQPAASTNTVAASTDDEFRSVLKKSTAMVNEDGVHPKVAATTATPAIAVPIAATPIVTSPSVPASTPVLPAPTFVARASEPVKEHAAPVIAEATPSASPDFKLPSTIVVQQRPVAVMPTPFSETPAVAKPAEVAAPSIAISPPVAQPQPVVTPRIVSLPPTNSPVAVTSQAPPTLATDGYAALGPVGPERADLPELAPLAPTDVLAIPSTPGGERFAMLDRAPTTALPVVSSQTSNDAMFVGSVTCNAGTTPFAPVACPYRGGQSGAPNICGVDCGVNGAPCCATWDDSHCIPWSMFGPGEYVGPARPEHVSTYFLRVNDLITVTFIASRQKDAQSYRIGVGDRLKLEWLRSAAGNEASLDREILVQPDGTIVLPLVGEVVAAGKTVKELQDDLVRLYGRYQREPQITVTPIEVNVVLEDLLKAVTSQSRSSGQALELRVTPEGTIQAPGLGSVYAQGLTLEELRSELEARYSKTLGVSVLVSPALTERATSYVFMGGEVRAPGRYTLEGPTTVMQAIALAGGWNNGGNLRQVVVFRRDENWCLKATMINIRAPYYGKDPCPVNDVWLRDNDLVVIPKQRILCAADVIELYFTRGVYAVFPITFVKDFSTGSSVVPVP